MGAGNLLVVDGAGICRAPIVEHVLRERFARQEPFADAAVVTRGFTAEQGASMCETAAARLGYEQPAISFFASYRAEPLTVDDIAAADLVLTAERTQRSAVVRMLPGTQAQVFTWKEALVLATVLADRAGTEAPSDLASLARALHSVRGTVPLIEPPVRTGVFHLRRGAQPDPLTVAEGHEDAQRHRSAVQESWQVATGFAERVVGLAEERLPEIAPARAQRWWRQRA